MAFENNKPSIVNSSVDGMRDISARMAATISNMLETAKKHGLYDAFAKQFNNLEFKLEGTIADGLPVCKLRFNKIN